MVNYILLNRKKFEEYNYVRKANPNTNYWFDFSRTKIKSYIDRFGFNFNIIIPGDEKNETDFYIIPYTSVSHLLENNFLAHDKNRNSSRWVGNIDNHILRVTNCPFKVDISLYYSDINLLENPGFDEENDFAIENRKLEVNVRIRQSKFRKSVLKSFNNICCISQISEQDLLVASHIIPWKDKIDTRLDPHNGLCLFVLYDQLFDKGYFTIMGNCTIKVTKRIHKLSPKLKVLLNSIDNLKITIPNDCKRMPQYLEYHNKFVFIDNVVKNAL